MYYVENGLKIQKLLPAPNPMNVGVRLFKIWHVSADQRECRLEEAGVSWVNMTGVGLEVPPNTHENGADYHTSSTRGNEEEEE